MKEIQLHIKKRMANVHGDVKIVNKTGIAKLNKKLKRLDLCLKMILMMSIIKNMT